MGELKGTPDEIKADLLWVAQESLRTNLVHGTAGNSDDARALVAAASSEVRARLGDFVYGEGDDTFAEVVGRALRSRGFRLAVAESCTGGLLGHLITSEPASDYFVADAVTYANSAKTRLLGVSEDVLRGHGGDWFARLTSLPAPNPELG